MLRRLLIASIGLMLAACTSQAPTATSVPDQGATSLPPAPATLVIVTRSAAQEVRDSIAMPLPGTLVYSEEEDVRIDIPFTKISVVRLRQGSGDQLTINGDGTFTYNGVPGIISPEQIATLNQAIKNISFYALESTFMSTVPQSEGYEYAVTVVREEDIRTITSHDAFMPNEYKAFVSTLWDTRNALGVVPTSMPPLVMPIDNDSPVQITNTTTP